MRPRALAFPLRGIANFRIGHRLGAALALLLCSAIAVVAFTLVQVNRAGRDSRALVAASERNAALAREAQSAAQDSALLLQSLLLIDRQSERIPVYARFDADTATRDGALHEIMDGLRGANERELLSDVERARDDFNVWLERTTEAVEIDPPRARLLMATSMANALRGFLASLDRLEVHAAAQARNSVAEVRAVEIASQRRILAFGLVVVALAYLVALWLARSITTPLSRLAQVAGEVAAGRFDTELPPARRDEIGTLVASLDAMRQGIAVREQRIEDLAFRDPLTSLPNRTAFAKAVDEALASLPGSGHALGVILIDLDRFRRVNSSLGHAVGDQVLSQVGDRLRSAATEMSAVLAHLGGDDFALLAVDTDAQRLASGARSILDGLGAPLTLDTATIDVGATIGMAVAPEHGQDRKTLLSRAETALYSAKRGRKSFRAFEASMDAEAEQGLSLLSELRAAAAGDEFFVVYQPKIALLAARAPAGEALVRWNHPRKGPMPPATFIPFAEDTGFIVTLTRWIFARVCEQLSDWSARGFSPTISVNVSVRDIEQDGFAQFVATEIRRHGVDPHSLCLEVTESAVVEDAGRAAEALRELRQLGIRLSIDDFGTGYASLAQLRSLPVDELKVDQSFVKKVDSCADDEIIVRSTIQLAHNLGLSAVAEGVETQAALEHLVLLGCNQAQGYFIARPLAADEFKAWWVNSHAEGTLPSAELRATEEPILPEHDCARAG